MGFEHLKTKPQPSSARRSSETPKTERLALLSSPKTQWKRALGNQAYGQALQAKLTISQPGDRYEQEADAIAEHVMHMPGHEVPDLSKSPAHTQRTGATTGTLQRKPLASISPPTILMPQNSEYAIDRLQLNPKNVQHLIGRPGGIPVNNPYLPSDSGVNTHFCTGALGGLVADAYGAEAVTIGSNIFGPQHLSPKVLRHELAHVAQVANTQSFATPERLEREAHAVAELGMVPHVDQSDIVHLSASPGLPLFHPALRTLLRAGRWLARRSTNTLSKHVARHGRRIAGRAIHSIFRNPRRIKTLVTHAVRDAAALARRQASRAADEVLEEGGVRVMQQATRTPGKFRTVIEKNFGRPIGTRGEQILRVVLDVSGRVVTAFPVDRFLGIGLGAIAIDVFTANTAEAAEQSRGIIEAHENQPTDWGEVAIELTLDIVSLGLLATSPLNEGEDLLLALDRIVEGATQDTIREIEEQEGIELTSEQRQAIRDLVEVAVGAPLEFEAIEEETSQGASRQRFIRSPDGSMLDTQTGRVSLGPGPKI